MIHTMKLGMMNSAVTKPLGIPLTVITVGTWPTPYSADDAKRSSQELGMSASRHPQTMVWAMFRQ
jgi:hypothetical protein